MYSSGENHLFTHGKLVICTVPELSMAIKKTVTKARVNTFKSLTVLTRYINAADCLDLEKLCAWVLPCM